MIPELHPQWRSLDLAQILAFPAAFIPIGQSNSLLSPKGAQHYEGLWDRCRQKGGVLEKTIRLTQACRSADIKIVWFRYEIFRKHYPQTLMDTAQYRYWEKSKPPLTDAQKEWDADLILEIKALMRPDDVDMLYTSLTNIFIGTPLPTQLTAWGVRTVILCGYHLDWCIESAARTARDLGFMPIVVGDACAAGREEDEAPALDRINRFFAPVLSAEDTIGFIRGDRRAAA